MALDTKMLPSLFANLLVGQIFVLFPFSVLLYALTDKGIGVQVEKQLPSGFEVFKAFLIFITCEEVGFYYTHRILHHRALYARFHKMHHEWKAPIALAAAYCHPVELIINNVLPLFLGPIIARAHIVTTYLWFAFAIWRTELGHCGYRFWFL